MTTEILPFLLAAHLVGDFLLQNNWMAARKATSTPVCAAHVAAYLIPFAALTLIGLPWLALAAIGAQHFAQDRWALHLKWMATYGQTPPDKWPVGPLCVDQAAHVAWLAVVALFI